MPRTAPFDAQSVWSWEVNHEAPSAKVDLKIPFHPPLKKRGKRGI
jgi:hypothetical protein